MPGNPRGPSLSAILAVTRERVAALQGAASELKRRATQASPVRPFVSQPGSTVGVIAEVKRRSPSQGAIREDLDPVAHARGYVRGGAVAVSVLTDEAHFGGSLDDLARVAGGGAGAVLPQDLILDELPIMEGRAAGASAVLLIARILEPDRLRALARAAQQWGLAALVGGHRARQPAP